MRRYAGTAHHRRERPIDNAFLINLRNRLNQNASPPLSLEIERVALFDPIESTQLDKETRGLSYLPGELQIELVKAKILFFVCHTGCLF